MRASEFLNEAGIELPYKPETLDNEAEVAVDDLESNADDITIQATVTALRDLIGQGHTEVDPTVITNQVVTATGKPFLLKDLVAINNSSVEVKHYIDSINPSKVKFSTDILTVKNEEPEKDQGQVTVTNMANRAASVDRTI